MEFKSLVVDPGAVKAFAAFLGSGTFVMHLQSRPKYGASREGVLQRVRFDDPGDDPDWFVHKVGQASLVPPRHNPDTLVLYATTNPVDTKRTNTTVIKKLVDDLAAPDAVRAPLTADRLWFHNAPKTMGSKRWLTFDVDVKDAIGRVMDTLGTHGVDVARAVETRGGYHLFVDADTFESSKALIDALKADTFVHVARDGKEIRDKVCSFPRNTLCPVPGTLQGGFLVRFVELGVVD